MFSVGKIKLKIAQGHSLKGFLLKVLISELPGIMRCIMIHMSMIFSVSTLVFL